MHPLRLSSLLLVLVIAGCATVVSVPNTQQRAQAGQAHSLLAQGKYAQAAQTYLQLAQHDRDARDYFRLRAAEAWREGGALDQAAQVLAQVQRKRLQPADAHRYDLLEAAIALKRGDSARALKLTHGLSAKLPASLQPRAQALRAQALAAAGRSWQAVRIRIALDDKLTGDARIANRTQALQLLTSMGATTLQQHAAALAAGDPAQRWIAQALAQLGQSVANAPPVLSQPVGTVMPGAAQVEGYQLPTRIALVLPLSGPLATAGDTVRQGFFASYFQASAHHLLPPVHVYDSGGTSQGAVAAYHEAVSHGATLVVGPLTHAGVGAIMQLAPLPAALLALNHPGNNALPPVNATEFAMRPEIEGQQIARYMLAHGIHQAIVLASSEGFAQRASQAFVTQFQGGGGQITNTLTLDPAQVDFSDQIRTLPLAHQPDTDKPRPPPPPGVGIFISMRPAQARLVMPQLHLAGIQVPVFATSSVYAGSDQPVKDGDLDGVTFCDAPWLFNSQPGLPSRAALANVLLAARGSSARFFAFGMDAWSLVPYLDWLREHPGSYLPGASGRLVEDAFGRVHRVLIWARFKNGVARPLTGSLELGAPTMQPATVAPTPLPARPAAGQSVPAPPASVPTHH